jgi:hypothetical protein
MQQAKANVVVATPCFGAMVHQDYMLSVIRLMRYAAMQGIGLGLEMLGHDSLITRSRNTLLGRFLDMPEATHLLFVDADIAFEPEQLGRMLAAEKDIVAGLYPIKAIRWDDAARARLAAGRRRRPRRCSMSAPRRRARRRSATAISSPRTMPAPASC